MWCILALKYDIRMAATILMIFLRINLPNFVQFKQHQGKYRNVSRRWRKVGVTAPT